MASVPFRWAKYALSTKGERDAAKSSPLTPGFYGHFPPAFNMYYAGLGQDYQSQNFFLGESASSQLYAITFHNGPGLQQMTLYPSPERSVPVLAVASNKRRYSSAATITLPASSPEAPSTSTRNEQLESNFGGTSHNFNWDVSHGDERRIEKFVWREKRGRPTIRRLTRHAEDKEETVAVWTEGTVPGRDGKAATFRFEGESAEKFGEYWVLMAVTVREMVSTINPTHD